MGDDDVTASEIERNALKAFFDQMHAFVFLKDTKNNLVRVNKRVADGHRLTPEEMAGRNEREFSGDYADKYFADDLEVMEARTPKLNIVEKLSLADGKELWIETSKIPVFGDDDDVIGILVVASDITEKRNAEHALKDALSQTQLVHQTKDNFLRHMSHELRTPLNAIIGFSSILEALLDEGGSVDKAKEYNSNIRVSGEQLLSLIEKIVEVTGVEEDRTGVKLQPMTARSVVETALDAVRNDARRYDIEVRAEHVDGQIVADEVMFRQALINLLTNAIKFSPKGHDVVVQSTLRPGHVEIQIEDNGIGISKEVADRLGEPFLFTSSPDIARLEGYGLGLALSQRLIERQGGELTLRRRQKRGTVANILMRKAD